jgi:hypothetical protein
MIAAVVNGCIVQLTPSGLAGIAAIGGSLGIGARSNSTTVYAPGWTPLAPIVATTSRLAFVLLPFALLAAWRTWVHANRRLEFGTTGWQGVVEAAALGLVTWFVMALPSILANPTPALAQVIVLSALASFLGLLVGLVLHATALITLRWTRPGPA